MNVLLNGLPERTAKPRNHGVTMVMDKGLSIRQTQEMIETCGQYIDLAKLGFGTSYVSQHLIEQKIQMYHASGIEVFLGGTLFEAFFVRNQLDDYLKWIDKLKLNVVEVSDGSVEMDHDLKCELINSFSKNFQVLSEVGSKDADTILAPYQWIELMDKELQAGAQKVIAEARESGTVGIYRGSGEIRQGLVNEILTKIPKERILWEAPIKPQQVYFIRLLGANVNLGNIAPHEVIPLETLRLGLRGDTFHHFLNNTTVSNTI